MKDDPPQEGLRHMLLLAWPLVVIQLSVGGMQFVDTLMVAPLGSDALAAVLPAGLVFFVPIAFSMGLLSSVTTFVSQSLGKKAYEQCGRFAHTGLFLACLSALCIMPLYFCAESVFGLFHHEAEVKRLEIIYFQVSLLGTLPNLLCVVFSNFFIGIHRPRILAIYAVGGALCNAFFNYLLIYGKWGLPKMGLAGAALGTVLAVCLQATGLGFHYFSRHTHGTFSTRIFLPRAFDIFSMIRIGLPSAFQFGFDILSWGIGLVWMVGIFGTAHLVATTIMIRVIQFSFLPAVGFAGVLSAVIGKAIGLQDFALARREANRGFFAIVGYMCLVGTMIFFFRHPLLRIFTDSPEILAIGLSIITIVCAFQFFDGANIVFNHVLRGAGDTFWPAVYTALFCLLIFIGGGLLVIRVTPQWGSIGIWWAAMLYIACLSFVLAYRWYFGNWAQTDVFRERPSD